MSSARARRAAQASFAALLLLHAALLWTYFVPALSSPDANCYHVSARLLAEQGTLVQRSEDPLAFVGGLWVLDERGTFHPKYPPVYPALAAAAELVLGHPAGLWVNPLMATLAVLATFAAAQSLLPTWAALAAAGVLATTPVFNTFAVDQIAHAPSVAALSAAFALFLWGARGRGVRGRAGTAAFGASGLLLGLAAGMRYTDVLLALPGILWLLLERDAPPAVRWRRRAAFALGLALPCLALAWYHWRAFGSPFATAYSKTGEQSAFSLDYIGRNLRLYSTALLTRGFGPLALLAPLGLYLECRRGALRALFWLAWTLPLFLLYCCYYYAPENHPIAYVRFLLPLELPAILLASIALCHLAGRVRAPRRRVALIAVVLAVQGIWGIYGSVQELELRYGFNDIVARRVASARAVLPEDALFFARRWLLEDLQYQLGPASPALLYENELLDPGRIAQELGQFEDKASIQRERTERWRALLVDVAPEEYRRAISERIDAALADGRAAFLMGSPGVFATFEEHFGADFATETVAELPAVEPRRRLLAVARAVQGPDSVWGPTSIARIRPRR